MGLIPSVKGTRDFYPEAMAFRNWLYEKVRTVSQAFGYQEYEAPFLERLELYASKSGEELVREQAYVFPDRGGEMIALRPELTPSLARMVAARSRALPRPIRWWSFGPIWRYERPQKGRTREFFQWNIDLLGVISPEADAELAAVAAQLFRSVGLPPSDIQLLVNDRRLVEEQYAALGIQTDRRLEVFRLVDRKDRMSESAWRDQGTEIGLSSSQRRSLEELLEDREAWRTSSPLTDFFDACAALGMQDYVAYDPSVIRGLDYYTGIVFEARDTAGRYRAILGGGRYDNLVAAVGGDPVPGTGFAMGDVVLGLLLQDLQRWPSLDTPPADVLVCSLAEEAKSSALSLAADLRARGLRAEWYPEPDRLPRQLKYADRQKIPLAAILGPEELAADTVSIKDLRSGDQQTVTRTEAAALASRILGLT
ncbi:MAG TPA: histidine--tRNA ligase [Anaerolineales bacterium]|nr:histidine--tRNA ligase [Anaerolineales bacterium]